MEGATQASVTGFVESLRAEAERMLAEVMEAVNAAPDGEWIAGSEEPVRDRLAEFRQQAFQRALQMRIDAAEAAFPPSADAPDGSRHGSHDDPAEA